MTPQKRSKHEGLGLLQRRQNGRGFEMASEERFGGEARHAHEETGNDLLEERKRLSTGRKAGAPPATGLVPGREEQQEAAKACGPRHGGSEGQAKGYARGRISVVLDFGKMTSSSMRNAAVGRQGLAGLARTPLNCPCCSIQASGQTHTDYPRLKALPGIYRREGTKWNTLKICKNAFDRHLCFGETGGRKDSERSCNVLTCTSDIQVEVRSTKEPSHRTPGELSTDKRNHDGNLQWVTTPALRRGRGGILTSTDSSRRSSSDK